MAEGEKIDLENISLVDFDEGTLEFKKIGIRSIFAVAISIILGMWVSLITIFLVDGFHKRRRLTT